MSISFSNGSVPVVYIPTGADVQSEDKIANNLKQVLNHQLGLINTRLDTLSGDEHANRIAQRVEKAVQASLETSTQVELRKA